MKRGRKGRWVLAMGANGPLDRGLGQPLTWARIYLTRPLDSAMILLVRNESMSEPTTLQEAIIFYADRDNCVRKLVSKRWPDGVVVCPGCGSKSVRFNAKRRTWQCASHHSTREF